MSILRKRDYWRKSINAYPFSLGVDKTERNEIQFRFFSVEMKRYVRLNLTPTETKVLIKMLQKEIS